MDTTVAKRTDRGLRIVTSDDCTVADLSALQRFWTEAQYLTLTNHSHRSAPKRGGAAETRFSGAGGRPLFEMAINLIARGDVSVAGIIIHRFALADLSQAYAAAASSSTASRWRICRRHTPRRTSEPTTASAWRSSRSD